MGFEPLVGTVVQMASDLNPNDFVSIEPEVHGVVLVLCTFPVTEIKALPFVRYITCNERILRRVFDSQGTRLPLLDTHGFKVPSTKHVSLQPSEDSGIPHSHGMLLFSSLTTSSGKSGRKRHGSTSAERSCICI